MAVIADPLVEVLVRIASALERLAAVAERAYPPPPNRAAVTPADEQAFSRSRLKELVQWQEDEKRLGRLPK